MRKIKENREKMYRSRLDESSWSSDTLVQHDSQSTEVSVAVRK